MVNSVAGFLKEWSDYIIMSLTVVGSSMLTALGFVWKYNKKIEFINNVQDELLKVQVDLSGCRSTTVCTDLRSDCKDHFKAIEKLLSDRENHRAAKDIVDEQRYTTLLVEIAKLKKEEV